MILIRLSIIYVKLKFTTKFNNILQSTLNADSYKLLTKKQHKLSHTQPLDSNWLVTVCILNLKNNRYIHIVEGNSSWHGVISLLLFP